MSFVSAGIGVAGVGLSAYKMIKEESRAKAAAKALENYKRQDFVNTGEGLQVSTLGADYSKENLSRMNESYIQALREGGTRALMGGLGRLQTNTQDMNKQIAADLDQQQKQIDMYKAQEEQNIRNLKEGREQQDIAGLSSQYNAGREGSGQALGSMLSAAGMTSNALKEVDWSSVFKPKDKTTTTTGNG